jgi:hypothetical protein
VERGRESGQAAAEDSDMARGHVGSNQMTSVTGLNSVNLHCNRPTPTKDAYDA